MVPWSFCIITTDQLPRRCFTAMPKTEFARVACRRICPRLTVEWSGLILSLSLASLPCFAEEPPHRDKTASAKKGSTASEVPADGDARMRGLLQYIGSRVADDHPYLGDSLRRSLREQMARLAKRGRDHIRWGLHLSLGRAELRLGDVQEAIKHLKRARELITLERNDGLDLRQTLYWLGVAHWRLGEEENRAAADGNRAVLPIGCGRVHANTEGADRAIEYFEAFLDVPSKRRFAEHGIRWLLNINYMLAGTYPEAVPTRHLVSPEALRSHVDFPRFVDVAPRLGVNTFGCCGGVVVDDFNGDGFLDIVTSSWDPTESLRYFENDGDGSFSNRTSDSRLRSILGGLNLVQADYDNDGDLDLFVMRGGWLGEKGKHPNSLLQNRGDGSFKDVTFDSGLGEVHLPTQTAAWADYDLDGDVDLFVGNESNTQFEAPCQLFQNRGDGTFVDVAKAAGVQNLRMTKGAAWGDFDGDRYPDLFVSNLLGSNRLFKNRGDGTFEDVTRATSAQRPIRSFSAWTWDFDNDGALDLFAGAHGGTVDHVGLHYRSREHQAEAVSLYRGDGKGKLKDVTLHSGLTYPFVTVGGNFGDIDGDGYLDACLGTGVAQQGSPLPNILLLNQAGKRFADVTTASGVGLLSNGNGTAFADVDNDGDLDLFQQQGGASLIDRAHDALFENPGFGTTFLRVKLVGTKSNRGAIGSRIRLQLKAPDGSANQVIRYVSSGGSYGGNPLRQTIGLGHARRVDRLEIFWPASNTTQVFDNVAVDQTIEIVEGRKELKKIALKRLQLGRAPQK